MIDDSWKQSAACRDYDTNLFFDKYEEGPELRPALDKICQKCPVASMCFAVGISQKEWGVWGGVYMENGKISRDLNRHKTKQVWSEVWKSLTQKKETRKNVHK